MGPFEHIHLKPQIILEHIHCRFDRYVTKMKRVEMNNIVEYNGSILKGMKLYTEKQGDFLDK